jgi:hypothetical protein
MDFNKSGTPIGKIQTAPVRDAFRHEAIDFTRWLEQNIESLSERIELDLTVLEREKTVGDFHVDLVCQDEEGNRVIIENQLERTNHDHLGKLLTYLVNLEAHVAIWIATEPRPEHQRVIDWLNGNTGENFAFYFVKVEAIRIGESPYAPLFTVLAKPDVQTKQTGILKQELAEREQVERYQKRNEFWIGLLEKSNGRTALFRGRTPPARHYYIGVSAGKRGISLNYVILKDGAEVSLYIDVKDKERNKSIFDKLYGEKEAIEKDIGAPLNWNPMYGSRASRIYLAIQYGGLHDPSTWPELQDEMVETVIRFDQVFRPRLTKMKDL